MRIVPLRRLLAGLFAVVFAVSGLTRELVGTCPQHSGGHGSASGTAYAPATQVGAARAGDAHARHDATQHASTAEADPGHAPGEAPAPADSDHGAHCDCIGDCCGCATVRVNGAPPIAIASDAPITTPRVAYTVADRPAARVDIALPFANAPPATVTI